MMFTLSIRPEDMRSEWEQATGREADQDGGDMEEIGEWVNSIVDALVASGHSVAWSYQQSVGNGVLLQSPRTLDAGNTWFAAIKAVDAKTAKEV